MRRVPAQSASMSAGSQERVVVRALWRSSVMGPNASTARVMMRMAGVVRRRAVRRRSLRAAMVRVAIMPAWTILSAPGKRGRSSGVGGLGVRTA